jgi:hypothetical protein
MIHAGRLAATLLVVFAATPVLADNLPAAAIELGPIRRNEQGRIEVVRTPADGPAVGRDGSQVQVLDKKVPSATANGRTIVVGPQEEVRSISEAARMARDGDTIEILPGEYRQQAVVWTQGRLTIRGVGKRPLLLADGDQRRRQGAVGGAQRRDADREHRIQGRARSERQRRRDSLRTRASEVLFAARSSTTRWAS